MYNYWFAKPHIRKTSTVCLCEGPGDVWRLEEAGIQTGVAAFGVNLSDQQQVTLEMSGAMNVVVLLNSDQAGKDGATNLKQRLGRSFRLHFPTLATKDLGEMSVPEVKGQLAAFIHKIQGAQ